MFGGSGSAAGEALAGHHARLLRATPHLTLEQLAQAIGCEGREWTHGKTARNLLENLVDLAARKVLFSAAKPTPEELRNLKLTLAGAAGIVEGSLRDSEEPAVGGIWEFIREPLLEAREKSLEQQVRMAREDAGWESEAADEGGAEAISEVHETEVHETEANESNGKH